MILLIWLIWIRPSLLSDVQLFKRDLLVRELGNPVEFRHFVDLASVSKASTPPCSNSKIVLAYSGICPHCVAFAPIWSALAQRLNCNVNENLKFGAFECTGSKAEQKSLVKEWNESFNATWPNDLPTSELTPLAICNIFVPSGYPTLLLAAPTQCQLNQSTAVVSKVDLTQFVSPNYFVAPNVSLYILKPESKDATGITDTLIAQQIASQCPFSVNGVEQKKALINLLMSAPDTVTAEPNTTRWPMQTLVVNPDYRLHDAIMGIYHILGSWIIRTSNDLTHSEIAALLNFFLLLHANLPDLHTKRSLFKIMQRIAKRDIQLKVTEWNGLLQNDLYLMGVSKPQALDDVAKDTITCTSNACTVWTLLHELSARNYASSLSSVRSCLPLFDAAHPEQFDVYLKKLQQHNATSICVSGKNTIETIRQVINLFFNCDTCRVNFENAYESREAGLDTWVLQKSTRLQSTLNQHGGVTITATEDLGCLLWLWRLHNIVNARTATERAVTQLRKLYDEDPERESEKWKIPFFEEDFLIPLKDNCTNCRFLNEKIKVVTTQRLLQYLQYEGESLDYDYFKYFNLAEVTRYLLKFYVKEYDSSNNSWNVETQSFVEETVIASQMGELHKRTFSQITLVTKGGDERPTETRHGEESMAVGEVVLESYDGRPVTPFLTLAQIESLHQLPTFFQNIDSPQSLRTRDTAEFLQPVINNLERGRLSLSSAHAGVPAGEDNEPKVRYVVGGCVLVSFTLLAVAFRLRLYLRSSFMVKSQLTKNTAPNLAVTHEALEIRGLADPKL